MSNVRRRKLKRRRQEKQKNWQNQFRNRKSWWTAERRDLFVLRRLDTLSKDFALRHIVEFLKGTGSQVDVISISKAARTDSILYGLVKMLRQILGLVYCVLCPVWVCSSEGLLGWICMYGYVLVNVMKPEDWVSLPTYCVSPGTSVTDARTPQVVLFVENWKTRLEKNGEDRVPFLWAKPESVLRVFLPKFQVWASHPWPNSWIRTYIQHTASSGFSPHADRQTYMQLYNSLAPSLRDKPQCLFANTVIPT